MRVGSTSRCRSGSAWANGCRRSRSVSRYVPITGQTRACREPGQRAEHADRRIVGPVQILDDQDDRCRLGQPRQHLADRIVEARGLRVGRYGQRLAGVGHDLAERGRDTRDDRTVVAERVPDNGGLRTAGPLGDCFRERRVRQQRRRRDNHRPARGVRRRCAQTSAARRVLPIPGSPAMSTSPPIPSRAAASRPASSVAFARRVRRRASAPGGRRHLRPESSRRPTSEPVRRGP